MKKILMLALVCSLATGAFANDYKPKKHKHTKECTQKCTPDCIKKGCCTRSSCAKA